jgi:thymidylate synthase (FAD)
MRIIKPSVALMVDKTQTQILKNIEKFGRICYKSEDKITDTSYIKFIQGLLKRGHEAVIEHESMTVLIICDRGVSHELVRHRIGSYCMESTRYVSYKNKEIEFIKPCFWKENDWEIGLNDMKNRLWQNTMKYIEDIYKQLIELGATPQEARSVLPNSLKTEIAVTFNLREWRHFLELRCAPTSHPQMREIALMCLRTLHNYLPIIFEDIWEKYREEI